MGLARHGSRTSGVCCRETSALMSLSSVGTIGSAGLVVYFVVLPHTSGQTLLSAPYDVPTTILVAPGQVLSLVVTGIRTRPVPRQQRARTVPVPTQLNGISVMLRQSWIRVQFDFRPNAAPSLPLSVCYTSSTVAQTLFAGLVPAEVGLYQINVAVPPIPPDTLHCGSEVQSNLTISVTSTNSSSFDGAAICVDPTTSRSRSRPGTAYP